MLAVLEDLLDSWPGTLLVVSHDRYLMERVTDDQFALLGGHIRHVPGGVDEYLNLIERAGVSSKEPSAQPYTETDKKDRPSGLSNAERRELKKRYDRNRRGNGAHGVADLGTSVNLTTLTRLPFY